MTIKNSGSGAIILKSEDITEELIQKISRDDRINKAIGILINYIQFIELYEPYKNFMTKVQFSEIIGIPYTKYNNLKRCNVKVDGLYFLRLRVGHKFKEDRYYSLEEINDFCKKYELNLTDILKIICKSEQENIIYEYEELLKNKKYLFIGNKPIDEAILNKYGEDIISFININSKLMGNFYKQNKYSDDVASDTIKYIIEKRGDLFCNFTDIRALEKIKYISKSYIKKVYLSYIKSRICSIDKINEELGDHHSYNIDKEQDIESIVIDKIADDNEDIYEKCINLLNYYIEFGCSDFEAVEKVASDLKLPIKDLLEIMKQSLLSNNKVKQTTDGKYYLKY